MRRLSRRDDGYESFELSSIDDLDLPAFLPMVDAAWKHDYVDQVRLDFNQTVLRKLLRGDWWTAILVCSPEGAPVGFELALERTLRVGERTLRAYYVSILTVSAEHRGRGLGRLVLEGINRLVFEERGADVIVSTFHEGHAGSPAVQSTFDRIPDWGVARFHTSKIWSRRLDRDPLPPLAPPTVFGSLEMVGDSPEHGLRLRGAQSGSVAPDTRTLDELILGAFDTSFALSESLSAQYLSSRSTSSGDRASGVLLYDRGDAPPCLAGWNVLPVAINERRLRPIGQLQLLVCPQCDDSEIERIVHHVALYLAELGCFAMSLVDMGAVPEGVLEGLGFLPTEDRITFAARGPRRALEAFDGLRPPYFVDFT